MYIFRNIFSALDDRPQIGIHLARYFLKVAIPAEIDSLRKYTNSLPENAQYIIFGDFNIYSSNEYGYKKLLDSTSGTGYFIDPLKLTGTFNNITYAKYHTQSPRVRSFQGGVTGGLDDRFDYILYNKAIREILR